MKNFQILRKLIDGELLASGDTHFYDLQNEIVEKIIIDSRDVSSEDGVVIFFALNGKNVDGHDFIDQVFAKNQRAIVFSDRKIEYRRSIQVKDINKTMAVMSKRFYNAPDEKLNVIAVTGTNGKTSISHMCKFLLSEYGKTGEIGTVEYDLGGVKKNAINTTPPAVYLFDMLAAAAENGCRNLAMEVSSHALCEKRAYGLDVDVAIFTNLTPEHLDFHETMDQYFAAKKALFDGRNGNIPKCSVINIDDPYGAKLFKEIKKSHFNVWSYGFSDSADFKISDIKKCDLTGSIFSICGLGQTFIIRTPLFGKHNLSNLTASFAASSLVNFIPEKFIDAMSKFSGVRGRLEPIKLENGAMVFIDYAHTPDAIETVLKTLNELKTGHMITIFGCGGNRDVSKRAPMTKIANSMSDFAIATSDNPRKEPQAKIFQDMKCGVVDTSKIEFIEDRKDAIFHAIDMSRPDDIILIAGKGHETYQIIGEKTFDFKDRAVVERYKFK